MRIPLISALAPLVFEGVQEQLASPRDPSSSISFTPRHAHAQALDPAAPLLLADTPVSVQIAAANEMTLRTRRTVICRPKSRPPEILSWAKSERARAAGANATINGWTAPLNAELAQGLAESGWEDVEVDAPDITDRQTLLTMAKMAANAYSQHDDYGWYPIDGARDNGTEFGWEPDADGLRGHIVGHTPLTDAYMYTSLPTRPTRPSSSPSRVQALACWARAAPPRAMTSST